MSKALEIAATFEHARNTWAAEASDILAGFEIGELADAIEAIARDEPFPPLWNGNPPHKLAFLAVPTLYSEIQRRCELMDLEGDCL
jgi:hypothetical protein